MRGSWPTDEGRGRGDGRRTRPGHGDRSGDDTTERLYRALMELEPLRLRVGTIRYSSRETRSEVTFSDMLCLEFSLHSVLSRLNDNETDPVTYDMCRQA